MAARADSDNDIRQKSNLDTMANASRSENLTGLWLLVSFGLAFLLGACLVAFYVFCPPAPRPFSSVAWASCFDRRERGAMYRDFLTHHHVVGMSKSELLQLLGKPDKEHNNVLSWSLGSSIFPSIDGYVHFKLKDDHVLYWDGVAGQID